MCKHFRFPLLPLFSKSPQQFMPCPPVFLWVCGFALLPHVLPLLCCCFGSSRRAQCPKLPPLLCRICPPGFPNVLHLAVIISVLTTENITEPSPKALLGFYIIICFSLLSPCIYSPLVDLLMSFLTSCSRLCSLQFRKQTDLFAQISVCYPLKSTSQS